MAVTCPSSGKDSSSGHGAERCAGPGWVMALIARPTVCFLPRGTEPGAVSRSASSDPTHEGSVHSLLAPKYPHTCALALAVHTHPRRT